MVDELQYSDLFNGHSVLSIFPRAFRDSKVAHKPRDSDDLEPIHMYMKSMALRSPDKLFEEAKAFVEGTMELRNAKSLTFAAPGTSNDVVVAKDKVNPKERRLPLAPKLDSSNPNGSLNIDQPQEPKEYFSVLDKQEASENNHEDVTAKGKENYQVRRPGLGRKRARFSLKPNTSQPSISLEPTVDIYQLQDPEEFFSAFEKLENAKKEIQRQMGSNTSDLKANNLSTNTRRRRPGILGRSVSYKHSYSSVLSEIDDTLISSQETLHQDIPTSSNCDTQQETTNPNGQSKEKGLDGSIAKTKNRVDEVWDELLSSTSENLDGDEALSFIQESLQIKPIDLDKLCLPNFHDIEMPDFVSLGEKMPETRKSFKSNLGKGLSCKTPLQHKQMANSPVHPLTSPTPPRNPFASISLLKRRILQSSPLSDPFSAHNIDVPAINLFPVEVFDQQLGNIDMSKELSISGKLKSLVEDGITNTTVTNSGSQKVIGGDTPDLFDKTMHENPSKLGLDVGAGSSGSHCDVEDRYGSNGMDKTVMNDSVSRLNVDSDAWVHGHNNWQENMQAEAMLQEVASHGQPDIHIEDSNRSYTDTDVKQNGSSEIEENLEDMSQKAAPSGQPDVSIEDSRMENLNNSRTQLDQQNSNSDHTSVQPAATPEISPEQHEEEQPSILVNEGINAKRPREGRSRKVLSRRQSLAEAGLLWNSGVRRSSRIKREPLEYWKGERFLYGRVHESLPTVIGVKYISPAKKGIANPTFRVQSYVSDDYKELVELAALH